MASKKNNTIDPEGVEVYFSAEEDVQQQDRQSALKTITEKELLRIAGHIGHEWQTLGIVFGFPKPKLDQLESVYDKSPHARNLCMLLKWCQEVAALNLNERAHLAKQLTTAGNKDQADWLKVKTSDLGTLPEVFYNRLQYITFDRDMSIHSVKEHKSGETPCTASELLYSKETITPQEQTSDHNLFKEKSIKLLKAFSLEKYNPEKLSLQEAMRISEMKKDNVSEADIPFRTLKKLIMLCLTARESELELINLKKTNLVS